MLELKDMVNSCACENVFITAVVDRTFCHTNSLEKEGPKCWVPPRKIPQGGKTFFLSFSLADMVNKDQQPARSSDQPIAAQTFQTSSVVDDFLAAIFSSNSRSTTATESNTLNSSTNNPDIPAHLSAIAKLAGSKRGREHQDDNDDDKKSEKRKNAAALPKANQSKTTVSSASSGNQRQPTSNDAGRVKQAAEEKRPQIDDLPPDCRLIVRHRSGSFREFDLRNRFSRYGQVLEVCLKSDFSFVQFPNPDICAAAVRGENGRLLNGQKLGAHSTVY